MQLRKNANGIIARKPKMLKTHCWVILSNKHIVKLYYLTNTLLSYTTYTSMYITQTNIPISNCIYKKLDVKNMDSNMWLSVESKKIESDLREFENLEGLREFEILREFVGNEGWEESNAFLIKTMPGVAHLYVIQKYIFIFIFVKIKGLTRLQMNRVRIRVRSEDHF